MKILPFTSGLLTPNFIFWVPDGFFLSVLSEFSEAAAFGT